LGLPDGNGQELMRELSRRYGLKGIALSGYGMEEDRIKSLQAGFSRHLTKPIHPSALREVIREVAGSGCNPAPGGRRAVMPEMGAERSLPRASARALVLNAGSSTLKWSVLETAAGQQLIAEGTVEWHGFAPERQAEQVRAVLRENAAARSAA